jgi:hypothetical protein
MSVRAKELPRPPGLSAVEAGAGPPDLAVGAGLDAEAGEPGERARPAREEGVLALRERRHRGPGGRVLHQHGVRAQQAAPVEQVGVVPVVEHRRRAGVAVHRRARRHGAVHGARADQLVRVVGVHRPVHGRHGPVRHPEPVAERVAVRQTDGVAACTCDALSVFLAKHFVPLYACNHGKIDR